MNRSLAIRRFVAGATVAAATIGGLVATGTTAEAQTSSSSSSSSSSGAVAAKRLKLGVANTKLGDIIVDASGMSLYMFGPDRYNVSVCEGQCLAAWPPVMLAPGTSTSDVELGGALRKSKLGYALREDGSRQLTYNGWALYYWFRDSKAGDVNGQWVNNTWWVMSEDGTPITKRP